MNLLVTQVWPEFGADPQFAAAFGSVLLEKVEQRRQSRRVILGLRSAAPLDPALCARLCVSLSPQFEGYEIKTENYFGYEQLTEPALRQILDELKEEGVPINGFLDGAPITLQGQSIQIQVDAGRNILESVEFPDKLADRLLERTGTRPAVQLKDGAKMNEDEWQKHIQEKVPAVAFAAQKKKGTAIKVPGLALEDTPAEVFHGEMFRPTELTPLAELGADNGKVMIWGDVFATETKGNFRKSYMVSITDYHGSINLKMRSGDNDDPNKPSKWEGLKPGTTLVVRGSCTYDKYEHDYVVYP